MNKYNEDRCVSTLHVALKIFNVNGRRVAINQIKWSRIYYTHTHTRARALRTCGLKIHISCISKLIHLDNHVGN